MPTSKKSSRKKPGKPPRNPYAILVRRRAAGAEPSPKAYRRRAKHAKTIPGDETQV